MATVRNELGGGFFQTRNPAVCADELLSPYQLPSVTNCTPNLPPHGVGDINGPLFQVGVGVAVWAGLSGAVFWPRLDSSSCLQPVAGAGPG